MESFRDLLDEIAMAKASGEPFAVATVVRTVSLTSAKAGAKAIIRRDGTMSAGWIGGGCARGAVLKAAREALADGKARLISVQPPEELNEHGHNPGEIKDGTQYARTMCPSKGTTDIFIEPFISPVELVVCGATPIAVALADLGRRLGYRTIVVADPPDHWRFGPSQQLVPSWDLLPPTSAERYVVVATQGRGDEASLAGALSQPARYVAFVGSHRKAAALHEKLALKGIDDARLAELHAPAGLDLGSVTPEEIALSILAEITLVRRRGQALAMAVQTAATEAAEQSREETSHGNVW